MTFLTVKPETGRVHLPRFSSLFDNFLESEVPTFLNNEWIKNVGPAVNIKDTKDAYVIYLAAPGLQRDSFSVKVVDGLLEIAAQVSEEQLQEHEKFTRKEFAHFSFKRNFTLPKTIAADRVTATYENGILKVLLPKIEDAKPKGAIDIKVV